MGGEAYRVTAYVDDLVVVTDRNRVVMRTTADALDNFCRVTNSVLNKAKTKSLKTADRAARRKTSWKRDPNGSTRVSKWNSSG